MIDKDNGVPVTQTDFEKGKSRNQEQIDKMIRDMDPQQLAILKASPRMRSIENKEEKDRLYQDDQVDAYLKKYTTLSRRMAIDYKK